jgi:hypothetical protein
VELMRRDDCGGSGVQAVERAVAIAPLVHRSTPHETSGRRSSHGTPVARSIPGQNSAGGPFHSAFLASRLRQLLTLLWPMPRAFASFEVPPAISMARSSASRGVKIVSSDAACMP